MTAAPAIEIKGLVKNYGKVQALRGVDLTIPTGQILGFLGPNGAGKTTTIRCMLDLIRPQSGTIRVLGMDPQEDPVGVRAVTSYLPGELSLEDGLTARQQLQYLAALRGNKLDWSHVRELAERIKLDLTRPIKNLSKGNKQKVGVVSALMHRPKLLILDEPTSGLDPLIQQEVYHILREAQADGATVFFSSHIISEVETLAERVAIIRDGLIVEEADPAQLVRLAIRHIAVRFRDPVDVASITAVPGVTLVSQTDDAQATFQVEGEMDGLIKALAAWPVANLDVERPNLEEIFLTLYQDHKEVL